MTNKEALETLMNHQAWRRGKEIPMLNPEKIGIAIDKAITVLNDKVKSEEKQKKST